MRSAIASKTLVIAVCAMFIASCKSAEESGKESEPRQVAASEPAVVGFVDLRLEPQSSFVATVQLYRGNMETSLPVLPMRPVETLTLEFDLMQRDGRPMRIEFVHVDRMWRDDYLNPSQYMARQAGDTIVEYRESTAPFSTYVHYKYEFPNPEIAFKMSGNYVLTVLDLSRDEPVLFQRPFVVTEESADAVFELRAVPIPGATGIWNQPYLLLDPRPFPERDIFDWGACFVKNVRFDLGRCGGRPSLFESPYVSFDLEPRASFEPEPDLHLVDISELRSGISVEEVYLDTEPYELVLVPDLADMGSPEPTFQNGQSAVAEFVADVVYPEYQAEYVKTHFRYIPFREKRAGGPVVVLGSFNGWTLDERNTLTWNEEERRYEGAILLKQGRHAYQYFVAGPRPPSQGTFAPESSYTALLYYFDPALNVDRLTAVRTVIAP